MRSMVRRLVIVSLVAAPAVAAAHIRMDFPAPRTTEQKLRHCGNPDTPRGAPNVFRPGETITVEWTETINHRGWYRLSFQPDGSEFELPLGNGGPCGAPGACGACVGADCDFPTEDLTGQTDPGTGSYVFADRIADGTTSFEITFPDIECANCTLQLIQLMSDGHGSYNETLEVDGNDIYYQCADITLSATLADAAPGPAPDADPSPQQDAAGNSSTGGSGGCSVFARGSDDESPGSSGILTAVTLVLLHVRRRRPS